MTMTNVFGPPVAVYMTGALSTRVLALLPSMAETSGGFCLVSHEDIAKISFISDTSRCEDSRRMIELFEETMDSILH